MAVTRRCPWPRSRQTVRVPTKAAGAEGPWRARWRRPEACPPGKVHVSYAEAVAHKDALCGKLDKWDIRRLGDGGAIDGKGYGCKIREKDPRKMGGAVCKAAPAVAVAPPPPAPAPAAAAAGWSCQPGIGTPVRFALGEIQCAAANGRDCLWGACNEKATAVASWAPPAGQAPLQPLSCGADHASKFGGPGYEAEGHWCRVACERLGCGKLAAAPPQLKPTGPGGQPVPKLAEPPPMAPVAFTLVQGEACPPGVAHLTLQEALASREGLCATLGEWDIRRLADGGAMVGRGYKCVIRPKDPNPMNGAICKAGPTLPVSPVAVAPPPAPPPAALPPPPAAPVKQVTSDGQFAQIVAAVKNEAFASDKERVLREAVKNRIFTVDQVVALLDSEGFGFDGVMAVGVFAPFLVDKRDNGFKLFGKFQFESEKARVKELLDAN